MWRRAVVVAILAVPLAACVGVPGQKGNDTGGIIPWSPENELAAFDIAQASCGHYNKFAVITSVRRDYGNYIVYECRWNPQRQPRRAA